MASNSAQAAERSLNGQVVIDEDEYTEALSQIIARDFFPSLVHLDATNEYLDALESRDPHLIGASVRRIEEINSTPLASTSRHRPTYRPPADTPYGYAASTPARSEYSYYGDDGPASKRRKYDTSLSLDEFQARYTSEDNSSFTQIIEEENRARKERWGWAWDAQRRVEAQRGKMVEGREKMLIEGAPAAGVREKILIEQAKPAGLITAEGEQGSGNTDKGKGKEKEKDEQDADDEEAKEGDVGNALILKSTEEEVDVLAPKKDTRPAGVDGWRFKARNSLMFPPDADISPYQPPAKPKEVDPHPKLVKYANTRLPEQEHESSGQRSVSMPPSPTRSRIDAAITGTPYRPRTPPGERGFTLVPNLPSPTPAELGPKAVKQLMTWGTITSTPRIISQTDEPIDPSTPFHISRMSAREALAHKLSNQASKSLRAKAEMLTPRTSRGTMAPPTMTPRRSDAVGNLTPAAKRLLERTTFGVAAARRADAMERTSGWDTGKNRDLNRVRWTPTPTSASKR